MRAQYGDGEVSCYAASVDDLKIGGFSRSSTKSAEDAMSTLAWFTLGVARTDDYAVGTSRNSHSRPLLHSQHVVRGYNRLPFSERVLSVHVPAGPAVPVTLATVPAWPGGKPEFIQLLVKDSEPEYTTDM